MNDPAIIVVGSISVDVAVRVAGMPVPGMTVLGSGGGIGPGGKGLNQAVAAQRAGCAAALVGRVGSDDFGNQALALARKEGINVSCVGQDPNAMTGFAIVTVSDDGENMIAVAPGANGLIKASDIEASSAFFATGAVLVAQLEIPIEVTAVAMRLARQNGVVTLLNPAPAHIDAIDLLPLADIVTPNREELATLSGMSMDGESDAALQAAMAILIAHGAGCVVVTLGDRGCASWNGVEFTRLPAHRAMAIDTTGAGDVFTGVLACAVADGLPLDQAMDRAQAAAAISVSRPSAQSAPTRLEIDTFGEIFAT